MESDYWGRLRDKIKEAASDTGFAAHIMRVENMVNAGMFDTNICHRGYECWLEGKTLPSFPKKAGTLIRVGLRESQLSFAIKRVLTGGRLFVWCFIKQSNDFGVGSGWYLFRLSDVSQVNALFNGVTQDYALSHWHKRPYDVAASLLEQMRT